MSRICCRGHPARCAAATHDALAQGCCRSLLVCHHDSPPPLPSLPHGDLALCSHDGGLPARRQQTSLIAVRRFISHIVDQGLPARDGKQISCSPPRPATLAAVTTRDLPSTRRSPRPNHPRQRPWSPRRGDDCDLFGELPPSRPKRGQDYPCRRHNPWHTRPWLLPLLIRQYSENDVYTLKSTP